MAGVLTARTTGTAEKSREPGASGRGVWWWITAGLVAVLGQYPLLRDPWVLYSDDAATQVLPTWQHLGELVRGGQWPPLLDPGGWMGGNFAVESLFGVWNPINALLWVGVSFTPNMLVAGAAVRAVAYLAIALGVHGLCREYGAKPWAASAVAVAMPFCGALFTFDALKWPAALVAFTWIPHLWWVARRASRRRANVLWVFVLGALAVTAGNPYAMLGVVFVLVGVAVETALVRWWRSAVRMLLVSAAVACVVPLAYLPLVLSGAVTWRTSELGNSGKLAPGIGDLLGASLPSYVPEISGVGDASVSFWWFALPLLPWFCWPVLRRRWRELGACLVVGSLLLVAVGPSELWMFRWPLRVLHYSYLAAAVPLAVLLSSGLRRDHVRARAWGSAGLLALSFYLAWSVNPQLDPLKRHVVAVVVSGGLTALAVWAHRRAGAERFAGVLQVGTVLAFGLQVFWFLGGHGASPEFFPASVTQARAQFEHRYEGRVLQIGDSSLEKPRPGRPVWHDMLPGSLFPVAGVESLNSYTGMGFTPFAQQLCMNYSGATCPRAYRALWTTPPGAKAPLADLLAVNTVVVQRKTLADPTVPPGWRTTERDARVVVLQRDNPAPRTGRVSWSEPDIAADHDSAASESVRFNGSGAVVFARLAWPGYSAQLNGAEIPVERGPAGLLRVNVPPDVESGQLRITWTPPGMQVGLACAAVGALGALVLGLVQARNRANKAGMWS
jgi:hypothetical protein